MAAVRYYQRHKTALFRFIDGAASHNADFSTGPAPASCVQSTAANGVPIDANTTSPLPDFPQPPGWSGYCTFTTPGTYSFFCSAHGGMDGTVVVTGGTPTGTPTTSPTETPTASPTATETATPLPTTAPPAPTVVPPAPTPVATVAPNTKVATASFKRSKRTLTISGTTTATGKVKVKLAYKVGSKARTKTASFTVKGGKFSGTLKLSTADAKKAAKLSVTVTASGMTAKKTVSVKR